MGKNIAHCFVFWTFLKFGHWKNNISDMKLMSAYVDIKLSGYCGLGQTPRNVDREIVHVFVYHGVWSDCVSSIPQDALKLLRMSEILEEKYELFSSDSSWLSDIVAEPQIPLIFEEDGMRPGKQYRVLSLFSGCGGMDLGFEGNFIASSKSFAEDSKYIEKKLNDDWVLLKGTQFQTVFANDILPEAKNVWLENMKRYGYLNDVYHSESIVDLVKMHQQGAHIFPDNIDLVTGGFPCQDFSVAGKRLGFSSQKDDMGKKRADDKPSEENRGRLYFWMKQVIDITKPKIFVAENVKGLVNLGDVKDIIQKDFASADGNGYIVLNPQVLHAADYGVPETRERVIFIGIRRNALRPNVLRALEKDRIDENYNPYPRPTHAHHIKSSQLLPPVCTRDVLKHLKEPIFSEDPSQQVYSKAKFLANGSQGQVEIKLDGLGPTIRSEHHGNIEFRRLSSEHGGKHTEELSAGMTERRLTPRECALIQTFPPDYKLVITNKNGRAPHVSSSGAYKVVGNAVPPVLAFHIAMRLNQLWPIYFER